MTPLEEQMTSESTEYIGTFPRDPMIDPYNKFRAAMTAMEEIREIATSINLDVVTDRGPVNDITQRIDALFQQTHYKPENQ